MVDSKAFGGFDYVALGHLHRPQARGGGRIRYSGSLLRYAFSEADHSKAVLLVDMDAKGKCKTQEVHLTPKHQVRCLKGKIADVVTRAKKDSAKDDYLMVTLLDEGAVFDALGKLREVYPNVLHIDRPVLLGRTDRPASRADHRKMKDLELFGAFFEEVTGDRLTKQQEEAYAKVVDGMREAERESQS